MTVRWDRLPDRAKVAKPRAKRRPVARGRYRCHACGEVLVGTYAAAERHVDGHGGGRIEMFDIPEGEQ